MQALKTPIETPAKPLIFRHLQGKDAVSGGTGPGPHALDRPRLVPVPARHLKRLLSRTAAKLGGKRRIVHGSRENHAADHQRHHRERAFPRRTAIWIEVAL